VVEDSLRLNTAGTLRDLAESTGGLVIANSNDLGHKLEQVASDLRLYYEVSYAPARSEYDGRFRRIEVKVSRKGVFVQARSGYFALPPGSTTLFPYEVPLLTALTRRPSAHDFDLHPVLSLGEREGPRIAVEVPLDGLPFVVEPKSKTYRLGLAIMAVVKSPDGQVLERLSDDYPLTGPAGKLDEVRGKKAVLRRRVVLPPGEYVLEAVAVERGSDRASVGRWRFSIPEETQEESAREMAEAPGATGRRAAEADLPPSAEAQAELGKGALQDLRQTVDLYRRGDVLAAIKARTDLSLTRATDQVDRLARQHGPAGSGAKESWSDVEVQAASLLQLETAVAEVLRGDPETAGRLFEQGERVALLVEDPARRARFRREWALTAAAFYRSRYDAGNARVLLERASTAAGDDMELLFARAVIHETVGSRSFAGSGAPRLSLAEAGEAAGPELAKAEDLYRRVLASTPGQVEARLRLGRTLFLEGRRAEALAEMDQALHGRRSTAEAHLAQLFAGAALEAAGDETAARARYDQALALEPNSRVAAMATARLLARTAKESDARAALGTLMTRSDDPTPLEEPWWRYRLGGFGEDSGFEERLARLRDEVRR
jgi:tetratricopeptide (TPR) repeat protein